MKPQKMSITLPPEIIEHLAIDEGDQLEATVKNNTVVLQTGPTAQQQSSKAFFWALLPAVISCLIFALYFGLRGDHQIALSGSNSIASAIIVLGVFFGTVLFAGFFIGARQRSKNRLLKNIYWRNFPTIILAVALILLLALLGIFWVFELIFPDISFDQGTATFFVLIFCFLINYMMIQAAGIITPFTLTTVFSVVIITGVIISMASNGHRHWWEYNLSFLGTELASNAWQFNLTLIFSSLIMIALVDYLFVSLRASYRGRQLIVLRVLLTLTAILLGAIGVFTNDARFHFIHDQIANVLALLVIAMIIGIKWMLPKISREFLVFSYIMGAILIGVQLAFKPIGYLSLTGSEILSFFTVFSWILILFQQLQTLTQPLQEKFIVQVSTNP